MWSVITRYLPQIFGADINAQGGEYGNVYYKLSLPAGRERSKQCIQGLLK